MKNTLILIPFFLLLYLVVFFVLSAFSFFAFWVMNYSVNPSVTKAVVIENIPHILYRAAPISTFFTLLLISFRVLMKPGKRFPTLLVLLAISSSVFFVSVYSTASFYDNSAFRSVSFRDRIFAERLNPVGEYTIYPFAISGDSIEKLVVYKLSKSRGDGSAKSERGAKETLTYYDSATVTEDKDGVTLFSGSSRIFTVNGSELSTFGSIFTRRGFIKFFLSDLVRVNMDISNAFHGSKRYFFLLSFSIIFLFVACGMFMRLTKWPLFNILLSLLVLRGVFYLYGFLKSDVASGIAKFLSIPGLEGYFPVYSFFLLGFLLFLIDFLFIPFDRWEREIEE